MMFLALLLAAAPMPQATAICRGVTVEGAVARYVELSKVMDIHALAETYGDDGVLVGRSGIPLTGSVAIERFFSGFTGKLDDQIMRVNSVAEVPGGWRTEGDYEQRGSGPDGPFFAAGTYRADWRCRADGWQLTRMVITPVTR